MPSQYHSSPFMSLRPDPDCGRSSNGLKSGLTSPANGKQFKGVSSHDLGYSNGYSNGDSNGYFHANGKNNGNYAESNGGLSSPRSLFSRRESNWGDTDDEFLRLDKPQQDLLLLHGPRQKYQLQKGNDLPQLQNDDEILVQVLAIGLNPVDWKGNDYDFGQPSYPWVNGRDFAGIVVKAPRRPSRVQQGDVVMGASTDYRDIRKAAYQEYLVTTDYNVSRIPNGLSVKEGAAVGVAFLASVMGLGICFGLDFSSVRKGPRGPDLLRDLRRLDPRELPGDIRDEIYGGISYNERPQPGEWIAVWGANGVTGQFIVQLCKLAGLKVACVADLAKGSQSLTELGADFMVDKYDSGRAVEILRAVTGGNLRFGIDVVGKETASFLQKALRQEDSGPKSHLLGLSGMPKQTAIGVVHHQVPLKVFHEAPNTGEAISRWLEQLFVAQALKAPQVSVAAGGLNGVNEALDQLRSGQVSGRRIVVPVGGGGDGNGEKEEKMEGPGGTGGLYGTGNQNDMSYHDNINSDPNRISFAYWVPNVSGGLVISKIPQRTHWDLKSNQRYAQKAEKWGFEYALSQIRFMAGYGAESQHEPVSISHAMLAATERIKLIIALLPGPWKPSVAAKMVASIDCYTEGRVCVNVVSGWFKAEFTSIGEHWLDHGERYRRSNEFIQCLKGIWTQEAFTFRGDFYQFHDYPLKPKPLDLPGRPHPPIFQGGNSDDAKNNAATVSDYYFMNGNTLEGFQAQIGDVKERAAKNDHKIGFAINAFIICRDTEAEAWEALAEIQGKADPEAVEGFRQQVQNAGASTGNNSGMWANSSFKDLIQYNDGFKTRLIGTADQIAERIMLLKALGASILLTAFLHYEEEIEQFGREIIPRVRKLEQEGRGVDEEYEVSQTGHIYSDAKAEDSNQAKVYTKHGWAKGQASK